jgi:uncharacterized protein YhbP (UPF0306 family)
LPPNTGLLVTLLLRATHRGLTRLLAHLPYYEERTERKMRDANLVIISITDPAGKRIANNRLSPMDVRTSLFQMLKDNVLCSMATITPDLQAHINTAFFSYSNDLELYFLSHPSAQHCRNLETNPSMAMTIFSSSQAWGGLDQGLQLFGTCEMARGATATEAAQSYEKRFPAYASWRQGLQQNDPGRSYRLYRFLVARVKVFDERTWGESLFVEATIHR